LSKKEEISSSAVKRQQVEISFNKSLFKLFQGVTMDPEVKQDINPEVVTEVETTKVSLDGEDAGTITQFSTTTESQEQWRQIGEKVSGFLADLPDYLTEFFSEYRRPIISIGLIFAAIISAKLVLAILDSIDDIPLLEPTLKLIGLGYSAWFVYRYLLRASNRKELADDFNALREQILGQGSPKV
jgi:hypothetical protein